MGSGLDFSGAGRIELGYRDLDKNWTVGLWVNRRESVEHNAVLMSGATGEIKLDQYQNTGKVGVTAYGVEDVTFDYSAPMDEWVHLTFVSNDQGTTLYVNGVEQDHIDLAINGPMNRIGGNNSVNLAGGGFLNATIDQLSVFDRSLTDDEVKDLVDVDSEPANKTLLEKTIAYAKGLDTTGVTDSAKAAFEKALAEAKAVMADANATQAEVNTAWNNLLEGIWGLGLTQGDKTMLEQLINKADGMIPDQDKYMPDHWQELVDALAAAKDVMADGDAMEEDIQPVAEALLNAILAQRFKADKSILDDLINKAEGINLDGYTAESVATFRTALANAQAVMADNALSEDDQDVVDKAVAQLTAAMDGLTAGGAPETTDKPETSQKPEATQKPENKVPQTGDNAALMLWSMAGAISLVGAACLVYRKNKLEEK